MRANFVRTVSSRTSPSGAPASRAAYASFSHRSASARHACGSPRSSRSGSGTVSCATRTVPSGSASRLVLERGDPGRRLSFAHPLPVCPPAGAERRACGLVADHRAEPAVGREVGHEQLARPDVAACSLDEEAVPADRGLDDALHDARVLGRHERVVRPEDDRDGRRSGRSWRRAGRRRRRGGRPSSWGPRRRRDRARRRRARRASSCAGSPRAASAPLQRRRERGASTRRPRPPPARSPRRPTRHRARRARGSDGSRHRPARA